MYNKDKNSKIAITEAAVLLRHVAPPCVYSSPEQTNPGSHAKQLANVGNKTLAKYDNLAYVTYDL